jgi:hypothetical protein
MDTERNIIEVLDEILSAEVSPEAKALVERYKAIFLEENGMENMTVQDVMDEMK